MFKKRVPMPHQYLSNRGYDFRTRVERRYLRATISNGTEVFICISCKTYKFVSVVLSVEDFYF